MPTLVHIGRCGQCDGGNRVGGGRSFGVRVSLRPSRTDWRGRTRRGIWIAQAYDHHGHDPLPSPRRCPSAPSQSGWRGCVCRKRRKRPAVDQRHCRTAGTDSASRLSRLPFWRFADSPPAPPTVRRRVRGGLHLPAPIGLGVHSRASAGNPASFGARLAGLAPRGGGLARPGGRVCRLSAPARRSGLPVARPRRRRENSHIPENCISDNLRHDS